MLAFERTSARDDDLRPVSLLAEHRDFGARLATFDATARDDPSCGEGLVRPQHVGELHVQPAAHIETTAEVPTQKLGDARERHAAADHRIPEAELLRGGLVVVIVPAAVEELVAHRFGERLAELDRQRLPGRLLSLPRAFLARRISQRDLAAGLLRQEALMMDAARDQVPGLVPHPHLLRDDLAIAPSVAIGHPRAAAQNLSNACRPMDLPFLTEPQVAEEVVEVPALELAVRLLIDDHRSHRSAERRGRRVPRVRLVEALHVVLDHLVGDRELERAEIFARVHVRRDHECDPPGANPEYATALCYSGGTQTVPNLSGRNVMSEPRFTTLTPETMTADQKRVADAIQSGPRGAGLRGPFNALLRSPELCDLVQRVGAYVRYATSIPQRVNELAIIMAGRKWTAQYEFYAHRRLALEAGLSPAIADAIAANQRPASMAKDEETVYDFVSELLATGSVSDPTFKRVNDTFGERGVVDLVGAVGYYSLVSMTLNVAQVPLPAGVAPPLK